jgi:NMD protein affecting ribosome stability and mRNA decay
MSETIFQKQKTSQQGKCIKCGDKNATQEDQLCDACRFMQTIDGLVKTNR